MVRESEVECGLTLRSGQNAQRWVKEPKPSGETQVMIRAARAAPCGIRIVNRGVLS